MKVRGGVCRATKPVARVQVVATHRATRSVAKKRHALRGSGVAPRVALSFPNRTSLAVQGGRTSPRVDVRARATDEKAEKLVGVDVGGTFTDVVYTDTATGLTLTHKVRAAPRPFSFKKCLAHLSSAPSRCLRRRSRPPQITPRGG